MEILSSRILLRPQDPARTQAFYRDTLGLAIHREFGPPDSPGMVFFCGNGLLEVSGHAASNAGPAHMSLWMQVRDVAAEYQRLDAAGVTTLREPRTEFWGLMEAWIADPDGIEIVLVQIPQDHPLRRDQR
ncbi:VOC family protein [Yaniella flava]|uniref:VOC family protein n=1 Tax=Yaniella flava TaxID=287930 RepID=A0ABP5FQP0_9MICC|nr:VOC family protein [Micrococcaceae bacterium]